MAVVFLTMWPRCPALVYRPYSQSGCSPACCLCEDLFHYPTMPSYSMYACSHTWQTWEHLHHGGKMWCRILCCGKMSTYCGTSQKASETWACNHHVSICTHTHSYTHTHLYSVRWGKNTTFCLSWRLQHQCHHIRAQQEKVILLFKAHPRYQWRTYSVGLVFVCS